MYLIGPLVQCLALQVWKLSMQDEHALVSPVPQVPYKDRHSSLAGFHNVSQVVIHKVFARAKCLRCMPELKLGSAVACTLT